MTTKKPVADPDIEPEYDFRDAVPNRYADRCGPAGTKPVVVRRPVSTESVPASAPSSTKSKGSP
jgi:hypothetical protein